MRLIDADALDEKLDALAKKYAEQGRVEVAQDYSFVQTVLSCAPTVEAPVAHGRWIWTQLGRNDWEQYWVCSECKGVSFFKSSYCSECGAKMDMEEVNG